MNDFNFDNNRSNSMQGTFSGFSARNNVAIRPLMRSVYAWMMLGLLTTAVISFFVASQPVQTIAQISQWMIPIVILQFGLVMGISWGFNKLSPIAAGGLFFLYAALNGLMFGVIFFAYIAMGDGMAIAQAFFTTAGLFGAMTVVGYTTNVDLSKFSGFFTMALIGLVIAIVVNIFLQSSMFDLIISVAGVLIFTALTAYDTQRIKEMAETMHGHNDTGLVSKLAVMGALKLYLDFINIFIFLLQIFGGGRD